MNKKPPLQLSAFVGSVTSPPSPSMCFPSAKNEKQRDHHSGLCGCQKAPKSHCISATGVLILVLLYTAMGSIIFVTLEGELEEISSLETAVAASKPYPRTELANAEIRSSVNLLNPYEEMGKKEQLRYLYEYHLIDSDRIKEGRIQSNATVDRLWAITEDLNILYKENWTRLAAQEVQHFQDTLLRAVRQSKIHQPGIQISLPTHKWSYASAFLYSLTLITTIGYGGISPRTQWGRIAALVYALFGIPIVLLYLSAMGEGLSAAMRCLFRKARGSTRSGGGGGGVGGGGNGNNNGNASNNSSSSNNKTPPSDVNSKSSTAGGGGGVGSISGKHFNHHQHQHQHQHQHHHHHHHQSSVKLHHHHYSSLAPAYQLANSPSVPISICIMVLISYVSLGAILFHKIQNWSVLEALYFCFTSLGTIGFGDLTPTGTLSLYLASGYILIGMAVVAMCFSLIQTEIILWLRRFSIQDHVFAPTEDVALVSVSAAAAAAASVTPKS